MKRLTALLFFLLSVAPLYGAPLLKVAKPPSIHTEAERVAMALERVARGPSRVMVWRTVREEARFVATTDLADCERATVQAAIDNSSDGEIITCPTSAGQPGGIWSWSTYINISNREVTFRGQTCTTEDDPDMDGVSYAAEGGCATIISTPTGLAINVTTCSAVDFVRITDIELRHVGSGYGFGQIFFGCNNAGGAPSKAWVVQRVILNGDPTDGVSTGGRWLLTSGVYGVLTQSRMLSTAANGRGSGNVSCFYDNSVSMSYMYHHPVTFGDDNAFYVESNYFQSYNYNQLNGTTDNYVCRFVFRKNRDVKDNSVGAHGFDSTIRGVMTWEIYDNYFNALAGQHGNALFQPRSGTGFFIRNTLTQVESDGFSSVVAPIYYIAQTGKQLDAGGIWFKAAPPAWYPVTPWSSYSGSTTSKVQAGGINILDGINPIMGNFTTPSTDAFGVRYLLADTATKRTCKMTTTTGSKTVTSSGTGNDCNFTSAGTYNDTTKIVIGSAFKRRAVITGCTTDSTTATITCPGQTFVSSDVELRWSRSDRGDIGAGETGYIQAVSGGTTFTASGTTTRCDATIQVNPCDTTYKSFTVMFNDPFINTVTNSTTAVMSQAAISTGTIDVEIGFSILGYPGLDMPGRGPFAVGNAGDWPNQASYSSANYQALVPFYIAANSLNGGTILPTEVNFNSTYEFIKRGREWYDQAGTIQVSNSSPFNGADGYTGYGTWANRPLTCAEFTGYWATDRGGNWDHGNASANDGALYRCDNANTWGPDPYWTPYTYPHPLVSSGPALTSVSPDEGDAGDAVPVTITGSDLDGVCDVEISGAGVTVGSVMCVNATTITATLTISGTAADGPRDLSVTVDDLPSNSVTFTVNNILVTDISPPAGNQGTTVNVTLTGTQFDVGMCSVAISGTGVTVQNTVCVNATTITTQFVIAGDATISARNVTVTNGNTTSGPIAFFVLASAYPTLASVSPESGQIATTVSFTLTGTNLDGANPVVTVSGTGVTVQNVAAVNATTITGEFVIAANATISSRTVNVTNDNGSSNPGVNFAVTLGPSTGGAQLIVR